jgi:hypothetical protein
MIDRETLEAILDDDSKSPYKEKNVDHNMRALMLLRLKIPYEVCHNIIGASEHDKIYLCEVDSVLEYLDELDAEILADCNLFIDSDHDCLAMFT